MKQPIIQMQNIIKKFPGVTALKNINFDVYPGEVHILIGENGAGKSTLMKILSGIYEPSEGFIVVNQNKYQTLNPSLSIDLGISIIYQELSVIDQLSVVENLFVGKLPTKKKMGLNILDKQFMHNNAKEILEKVGLEIDPDTLVEELSISQKQQVEIAKALISKAKVIIMDEPTSSLTSDEIEHLFTVITELKKHGVAVIYISHKMREVLTIGDRFTVLKDGEAVGTLLKDEIHNEKQIVTMMVGREWNDETYNQNLENITDYPILSVKNLSSEDGKINNVSFDLYKGEILGFSGLIGAGRTEIMQAIFKTYPGKTHGTVYLDGQELIVKNSYEAIKSGLGMITEDRRKTGFMPNFEIWKNTIVPKDQKSSFGGGCMGLLQDKKNRLAADEFNNKMNVKCSSTNQFVTQLSGGNQQKVIIAKWMMAGSKVLIFDEPTRGIDVGAKNEIYKQMRTMADGGIGIIFISSELPELLSVCDRIIVINTGKIASILDAINATEDQLMLAAT